MLEPINNSKPPFQLGVILGNLAQTSPSPAAETWPPASGGIRVGPVPLGAVPCYVSLRPFLSLDWLGLYSQGWALPALFGLSGPVVLSDTTQREGNSPGTLWCGRGVRKVLVRSREPGQQRGMVNGNVLSRSRRGKATNL